MEIDFIRPLLAAGVAALVTYALSRAARPDARTHEGWHFVEYGRGYKLVAGAFVPLCAFVTFAALQAAEDQRGIAAIVTVVFWAATLVLIAEVFFTRVMYNENEVRAKSAFKRERIMAWDDIALIGYEPRRQSYYLESAEGRKLWISPFFDGTRALIQAAVKKLGITPENTPPDAP
jgi:hypothetical protein